MNIGVSGKLRPIFSKTEMLSTVILAPIFMASLYSSIDTPLGVNMMSSGLKPAFKPRFISSIETQKFYH